MSNTAIRSPGYPSLSLQKAIDEVRKIDSNYRSSPVDREDAAKLIGFKSLSGPAAKALAALASFGLVERAGKGEMRVTDLARQIIHPQDDDEKRRAIASAAMEPQLFRALNERFPDVVPPEDGVRTYLNREGFNPVAVVPAAKAFLETKRYLEDWGAYETQDSTDDVDADNERDKELSKVNVGDFVQWESAGQIQFDAPQRVRMISDDGNWIAIDGSETGIPISEVSVHRISSEVLPETPPSFPIAGNQKSAPVIESSESEWMRNKLAKDVEVRLLVKGEIGTKEIGKLIRLLEAQRDILEDE